MVLPIPSIIDGNEGIFRSRTWWNLLPTLPEVLRLCDTSKC